MSTVISILLFLLIFCIIVISHELGHFIIAKANGIHVKEFFIGFGPTLIHWEKGGTKYSIKLLPLGGACVFKGMDTALEDDDKDAGEKEEEEIDEADEEGSFLKASVWRRFATVIAGPAFNIILGFILAFIMVNMIVIRDPVATEISEDGAAQEAGLMPGDRIVSMNGQKICIYDDIMLFNALYSGGEVEVVFERNGEHGKTTLTPKYSDEYGRYMIGIVNESFVELKGLDSLKYTWYEVRYGFKATYLSLFQLIRGKVKSTDIAGPVGIVNVVEETYESTRIYGWQTVLVNMINIAFLLTINLGLLNLLPIPALDGGRLLFILLEMLRGKPVPREKEALVHFIGIVFFVIIMVLVFFNDIRNVFFR